MISGKVSKKNYFDYLHSLFYSLHKGIYSGKVIKIQKYASGNLFNFTSQVKNFNQNFKRKSSPEIIKIVNKKIIIILIIIIIILILVLILVVIKK